MRDEFIIEGSPFNDFIRKANIDTTQKLINVLTLPRKSKLVIVLCVFNDIEGSYQIEFPSLSPLLTMEDITRR